MTSIELIERLEGLSGPCRETDALIAAHTKNDDSLPDWAKRWDGEWRATVQGSVVLMETPDRVGPMFEAKPYTASIDCAMTLVPEGYAVNMGNDLENWCHLWLDTTGYDGHPIKGGSVNLAIALCIASLKAKP